MSTDEERAAARRAGDDGDDGDPLEERTQQLTSETGDPRAESNAADRADTTTLGTSFAPPIVVEDETVVSVRPDRDGDFSSDGAAPLRAGMADASPSDLPQSPSLAPSSSLHPMLLERVEPSLGRGERLRLDAGHWKVSLGRAEGSDLRLYTASASREHAEIAGNDRGEWVLTPANGKSVLIDGDIATTPVVLEVGMNIILGQDHLRCVTEGLARGEMAAQTASGFSDPADRSLERLRNWVGGMGLREWAMGVILMIGIGLILFVWFGQ